MKNYRIYICFIILAALMIIFYPKEGKFQYEYQKGRPWVYETLISPIDFPILKTEAEMLKEKEERASETIEYYNYDSGVVTGVMEKFSEVALADSLEEGWANLIANDLAQFYQKGIVADFGSDDRNQKVIFIKKGKRVEETPATEVYDINIVNNMIRLSLADNFPEMDVDSIASLIGLKSFVVPNLLYDDNTTRLVHKEAVNYISPTKGMVYAGQLIVTNGEIVTSDICQLLDSYKEEYKMSFGYMGSQWALSVSHILVVIAILALFFFAIYFVDKNVLYDTRKLIFLSMMLLICYIAVVIFFNIDQRLLYLFPFAAIVLYCSAFFKDSLTFMVYAIMLLPLLIIPEKGTELCLMNFVAGGVALVSLEMFNRGWLQFINMIFIFLALAVLSFAFNLSAGDLSYALKSTNFLYLAINAVLVIVLHPFVYLFEKIFSFVSYSRLWDLSDTNTKLLQNLQYKAPGTFQHSMQVANLAENAARQIGADAMLTRVGALYHDIGKMENPMCFVENKASEGINYHSELTPEESARTIIKHVEDGMTLAKKYKLPGIVSDFISSHHGKGMTRYFYNVYCNAGGDPKNTAPFTYDGQIPSTKEQVIVMLADSVEAASRTLKDYSEESISSLVDRICQSKFDEGQFAQADISIKDIAAVKDSLKTYLRQVYHARIAYPRRKRQ